MEQHRTSPHYRSDTDPLRVGLLGCGTVGSEVARLLRPPGIPGLDLARAAVRDIRKPRAVTLPSGALTADALAVVKDPSIDVVVELIGGIDPALSLLRQALAEGKHVVTANKVLIASHGDVLAKIAAERSLALLFEGAVGGAVPMMRTLRTLASVDRVRSLAGVINGTTNFILSEMERGTPHEVALARAQAAGYAEADPSDDLNGVDAACKLSLLCSAAFGVDVPPGDIARRGIQHLSTDQIRRAGSRGRRFKLIATAERRQDGSVAARVAPAALDRSHPLAQLEGEQNGLVLETECSGALSLFGRGAGGRPTAAAVLADLESVARNHARARTAQPLLERRSS